MESKGHSASFRSIPFAVMVLVAAGGGVSCSDSTVTSSTASKEDALDLGYSPPSSLPVVNGVSPFSGGPNGANAGYGVVDGAGSSDSDPDSCRDCSMTNYVDLAANLRGQEAGRNLNATIGANPGDPGDLTSYADTLWSYGTNNGLRGMMKQATPNVHGALTGSYASSLSSLATTVGGLLNQFASGLNVTVSAPAPKTWAIAFIPIQTRAKIGERLCPGSSSCLPSITVPHTYNAQPLALREARFRGARSYCAMRECAVEQNATDAQLSMWYGHVQRAELGLSR